MRYRINEDPFFKKQPEKGFINELISSVHTELVPYWNDRDADKNEIKIDDIKLIISFEDNEGLLESAYSDFKTFLSLAKINQSELGLPFIIDKGITDCFEAYIITVTKEFIKITAADTEGIRRALIYIEDEMQRRSGSFLPIGEIKRKPFIKTRISRCFFTPPSHASNEGLVNELASDIDYYPDEYLNRLAHDGINGLWLGASFRDILKSEIVPEFGADSERRIKKLNQVVEKCRRYGIGIYLFSVEPASAYENPIFKKHTELHGGDGRWAGPLFCTTNELGERYVKESASKLFTEVPHLKGFINITTGECCSACGSTGNLTCPRCKKKHKTVAKTLASTEKLFADAMHSVSPDAEFISWTYAQRGWNIDDVIEACESRDSGVIHMQNFEDLGRPLQLGKKRLAIDYWLSYVGPGELMEKSVEINKRHGIRTFAKIQACSSHEISSVPYVPAPGILYDKYKYMHENGISGALQCWYFGNYPCLMNKAACELSFETFFDNKNDFLKHLAGIYWGRDTENVVKAWQHFENGYKNFPVSVSFEWFGPMQDSTAAPMHLKPVDLPMPSTWLIRDMVGGDRIGDCLLEGHTIEEALILLEKMSEEWEKGNSYIKDLSSLSIKSREEQKSVSAAIDILFRSGYNIVKFYSMRRLLGIGEYDNCVLLREMELIVKEEIENSKKLSALCEKDSRLGYHSEACGYKFFPEKLNWRIGELEKLLVTEFPEVRERISQGLAPLAFYLGEENGARTYHINSCDELHFLDTSGNPSKNTSVSASEKEGRITLIFKLYNGNDDSITVKPEFRIFHPSADFILSNGGISFPVANYYSFTEEKAEERKTQIICDFTEEGDLSVYKVSFNRSDFGMESNEPFRISVKRSGACNEFLCLDDRKFSLLTLGEFSPDSYCFFIKK